MGGRTAAIRQQYFFRCSFWKPFRAARGILLPLSWRKPSRVRTPGGSLNSSLLRGRLRVRTLSIPAWLGHHAWPLWFLLALVVACLILLRLSAWSREHRLRKRRVGVTQETFTAQLEQYGFDPVITGSTFRYLREVQLVPFPVLPGDDLRRGPGSQPRGCRPDRARSHDGVAAGIQPGPSAHPSGHGRRPDPAASGVTAHHEDRRSLNPASPNRNRVGPSAGQIPTPNSTSCLVSRVGVNVVGRPPMEFVAFPQLSSHDNADGQHGDPSGYQPYVAHKSPARLRGDVLATCAPE